MINSTLRQININCFVYTCFTSKKLVEASLNDAEYMFIQPIATKAIYTNIVTQSYFDPLVLSINN